MVIWPAAVMWASPVKGSQAMVRRWSGDGQAMVRRWSGGGQAVVRQWSGSGQGF